MASRPIQPRSGEKHILFGTKFKRIHKFTDANWTADHRMEQYNAIISVYAKNQILRREEKIVQDKLKAEHLRDQLARAESARKQLRSAQFGQKQIIKNLFKNHRDMQRVYPMKLLPEIVTDMDMRIFHQRKRLDRLLYARVQMSKSYEANLFGVAKLQDRLHIDDAEQLSDNVRANQLAAELLDIKVRLQAVESLNRTCTDFIDLAMNDALYLNPICNAIQDDIVEQNDILRRIVAVSEPAVKNFAHLKNYLGELNEKSMLKLNARIATLLKCKTNLQENAERIRRLIRTDFDVPTNRYCRETDSMLALKIDCDGIEKQMQALIAATASASVDQVFAHFQQEIARNNRIQHRIQSEENEMNKMSRITEEARASESARANNFTTEDIYQCEIIEAEDANIGEEQQRQWHCAAQCSVLSTALLDMKRQCLHLDALLQHVGDERTINPKPYADSYLSLPLLKFDSALECKITATEDIEDNLITLFDCIARKIDVLIKTHTNDADDEFNEAALAFYHDAVLDKVSNSPFESRVRSVTFDAVLDKTVLDRRTIKTMCQRILAENSKKDE